MPRPQRVAVTGVSHWHSTYDAAYLRILADLKLDIVGVSDKNGEVAQNRAVRFDSTAFADYRTMIEETRPEFVVALGRHVEMPEIFRYLVGTGIPFMLEKPWGVDAETVAVDADLAEEKGTWVAVPFITRYSHWAEAARQMIEDGEFGAVSHIVFRMIRPTAERYKEWDSPWVLSRRFAGGGALTTLGVHGMDIARFITGEDISVVSAVISSAVHRLDVEDYAMVTLRTSSGIVFNNEVGYTMPTWPLNSTDAERKVAGEAAMQREVNGGLQILAPHRNEVIPTPSEYVDGYRRVVIECLDRIEDGRPPPVGARDCARAMTLIHDAYMMARKD